MTPEAQIEAVVAKALDGAEWVHAWGHHAVPVDLVAEIAKVLGTAALQRLRESDWDFAADVAGDLTNLTVATEMRECNPFREVAP